MADADRPAADPAARVIPLERGRRGRRFAAIPSAGDVARRLAALEQQVEQALAGAGSSGVAPLMQSAVDEMLGTYGRLRRWVMGELPPGAGNPLTEAFYQYWWRVEVVGLERIPTRGRVLVMANRSGTLVPYEALMLALTLSDARFEGRPAHALVDEWLTSLPVVAGALQNLGALPSTTADARRVLAADCAAIALPEGRHALAKPYSRRYRLAPFGRGPLFRVAIATGTPIVPVAIIGCEEVHPVLWGLDGVGRSLGLGAPLPVTASLVPLPAKWTMYVGDPLDVAATYDPDEARNAAAVRAVREQLRERLQALLSEGLRRRQSIFR